MLSDKSKALLIGFVVIVQAGLAGYVTWYAMRSSVQNKKLVSSTHTASSDSRAKDSVREIYRQMLLNADEIDASAWKVEPAFFDCLSDRRSKTIKYFKASRTVDDTVVGYLKDLDVHHLALIDCHVTARCFKDLASIKPLEILEINHLRSSPDDWRGIVALENLHDLHAKYCGLNDRGLQILSSHSFQLLDLRGNWRITDAGVAYLKHEKLDSVSFAVNSSITDHTIIILSQVPTLTTVDLFQTKVGDRGLLALARLRNLRVLSLSETQITDDGLRRFKPPAKLQNLILSGCKKLTPSCIKEFQLKYPTCVVESETGRVPQRVASP